MYTSVSLCTYKLGLYAKNCGTKYGTGAEVLQSDERQRFNKSRPIRDCVFTINQLTEKRREFSIETHLLFIGYEKKAFDRIKR
jgi:hypothetical protein